jgi:hypothetical protein
MPRVGFEPTIPVFERAKTFLASDCAAAVFGSLITEVIKEHEMQGAGRTRSEDEPCVPCLVGKKTSNEENWG